MANPEDNAKAANKAAADKAALEKAAQEKVDAEKIAVEKEAAEKEILDKEAAEKAETEKDPNKVTLINKGARPVVFPRCNIKGTGYDVKTLLIGGALIMDKAELEARKVAQPTLAAYLDLEKIVVE